MADPITFSGQLRPAPLTFLTYLRYSPPSSFLPPFQCGGSLAATLPIVGQAAAQAATGRLGAPAPDSATAADLTVSASADAAAWAVLLSTAVVVVVAAATAFSVAAAADDDEGLDSYCCCFCLVCFCTGLQLSFLGNHVWETDILMSFPSSPT